MKILRNTTRAKIPGAISEYRRNLDDSVNQLIYYGGLRRPHRTSLQKPDEAQSCGKLAEALEGQGKLDGALQAYEHAAGLSPPDETAACIQRLKTTLAEESAAH